MKTILTLLTVLIAYTSFAQSYSGLVSQNLQQLNPAYTGTEDDLGLKTGVSVLSSYRSIPAIMFYSSNGQHLESLNSGLGFAITLGRNEYSSSNIVKGNYNYKLKINPRSSLRFGASYRYEELQNDGRYINAGRYYYEPIDYRSSALDPALWYENDSLGIFAGIATNGLIKISESNQAKTVSIYGLYLPLAEMNYTIGKRMQVSKALDLLTTAIVTHTIPDANASGISFQTVNLSTNMLYKEKLNTGLNYYSPVGYNGDLSGDLSVNIGYSFHEKLRFTASHFILGHGVDRKNIECMLAAKL